MKEAKVNGTDFILYRPVAVTESGKGSFKRIDPFH
jgi:hypothetical protein